MSITTFHRPVKGHYYMFLVSTREVDKWENPATKKVEDRVYWLQRDAIKACDIFEVCGKLKRNPNDVRFESKSIVR